MVPPLRGCCVCGHAAEPRASRSILATISVPPADSPQARRRSKGIRQRSQLLSRIGRSMQEGRSRLRAMAMVGVPSAGMRTKVPASCPAIRTRIRCPLRIRTEVGCRPKLSSAGFARHQRRCILASERVVGHLQFVGRAGGADLAVQRAQLTLCHVGDPPARIDILQVDIEGPVAVTRGDMERDHGIARDLDIALQGWRGIGQPMLLRAGTIRIDDGLIVEDRHFPPAVRRSGGGLEVDGESIRRVVGGGGFPREGFVRPKIPALHLHALGRPASTSCASVPLPSCSRREPSRRRRRCRHPSGGHRRSAASPRIGRGAPGKALHRVPDRDSREIYPRAPRCRSPRASRCRRSGSAGSPHRPCPRPSSFPNQSSRYGTQRSLRGTAPR